MSGRALRRHHYERLRKRRKVYWGDYGEYARPQTGRTIGRKVSAPKPQSSCECCINPRKYCGPTRQELKATIVAD